MIDDLGVVILALYGAATAVGGAAALRQGHEAGIGRMQAAVFGAIGLGIGVTVVLSRGRAHAWILGLSLLSVLCRVWNGRSMGGVWASHLALFAGVLALGSLLTYVQ